MAVYKEAEEDALGTHPDAAEILDIVNNRIEVVKAEPFEGALRVLISAADVCRRVEELAAEVAADLSGSAPVIVGILNGAAPFMMDLLRFLPAPLAQDVLYDFVDATSYSGTESTGAVKSSRDLSIEVGGRPVLVVDGIVDTGQTLAVVLDNLRDQQPAWLRTCVLFDKPSRRRFAPFALPSHRTA